MILLSVLLPLLLFALPTPARSQIQAHTLPGAPISSTDRIYTGDQSSNTITVLRPSDGLVLGTIALGSPRLSDLLNPQYTRGVNAHGLGAARDGTLIVALSVTSNTATVIRTRDNAILLQTATSRAPHEAAFEAAGELVWVATRGVDYLEIVDALRGGVVARVDTWGGPSKVLFSPDGRTAYVNHVRSNAVSFIDVASRAVVFNLTGLVAPFSSDMMLSGDGARLWVAHKMAGKVSVISTASRRVVSVLETGPETNHPHFSVMNGTTYGFVTVAARNATLVYAQPDAEAAPELYGVVEASGVEPHGLAPSPDGSRMFVLNEHSDTVDSVDTASLTVVKTVNVGQEGQALIYVANAVPEDNGTQVSGQNLGQQGLMGRPALNKLVTVDAGGEAPGSEATPGTALITIRPQQGLDMFQVIGRNLKLNTTYRASAACLTCAGTQIPIVDFAPTMPTTNGCGNAPQVLAFLKFTGVYDVDSLEVSAIS